MILLQRAAGRRTQGQGRGGPRPIGRRRRHRRSQAGRFSCRGDRVSRSGGRRTAVAGAERLSVCLGRGNTAVAVQAGGLLLRDFGPGWAEQDQHCARYSEPRAASWHCGWSTTSARRRRDALFRGSRSRPGSAGVSQALVWQYAQSPRTEFARQCRTSMRRITTVMRPICRTARRHLWIWMCLRLRIRLHGR